MATVKSVINPSVTANTPFAYTAPNGLSGYVTTMMLDDNEVVVMVFDDAVDQIGSNVTVKHPIDMSDYWTLDPYYSNVTEGDFFNIGTMNIEFEGNTYTLQHVIYYLNAGWWLTRRSTNGEYVASGKNVLSSYGTVYALPDGLTLSDIESPDTDIEGLKPPTSFPSLNFLTVLGSDYEQVGDVFRLKDAGSGGGGGTTPDSNAVDLTSKTEIGNNTFDFSNDFKNSWDYSKFKAIAGFQNYVFRGQVGLLEHFKAGWSHLEFQSYYPTSQSLGEKSAARFSMFQWFVENSNINGAANSLPSKFSTLKNAILSRDFLTANQQSHEAWEMLGAQLSSHLLMYKDIQSGADKFAGVCILDEESNVHLSANGGGPATLQFIAKVCQYVTLKTANSAVIHYGYPANSVHWSTDMWYKDTNLNSCKTELPMAVAKPSFDYYFDGTTTYCKSPLPVSSSLYKKDGNGNYIISGGKRVLRTDPFSEYFGGIKNTWHPSFYNPYSNNYDPIYDGNGEIIGVGIISTITGVKVTDIEYAVAFSFRYVSLLKLVMGTIANQEGGGFDITRYYNSVYKPIAVMNTLTEPFTTGGNGFFRRWIGEEQLKFLYLAPLFAGYDGIYNYEDGFLGTIYYNPDFGNPNNLSLQLPTKGNKIAPWWFFENYQDFGVPWNPQGNNDHLGTLSFNQNLSRFNWITTAVAVMRGVMSYYTKNNTLRFALFNPIGGGINNREVIMLGLYQGSHMHILAYYPFQDITDTTVITFTINGTNYTQILRPRKCEVYYFNGSFGSLNPVDIKAQYNNIDGTLIKVTGDPSNHTW